jgi:hypothetical protein
MVMAETRRRFDPEFKTGAVRIVRETNKPVAQVARDLGINEGTLANWVNKDIEQRLPSNGGVSESEPCAGPPAGRWRRRAGGPRWLVRQSRVGAVKRGLCWDSTTYAGRAERHALACLRLRADLVHQVERRPEHLPEPGEARLRGHLAGGGLASLRAERIPARLG